MGLGGEIRHRIAGLQHRRPRLEEVRLRAKRQGGPEGEHLEARARTQLQEISRRINDPRASLD